MYFRQIRFTGIGYIFLLLLKRKGEEVEEKQNKEKIRKLKKNERQGLARYLCKHLWLCMSFDGMTHSLAGVGVGGVCVPYCHILGAELLLHCIEGCLHFLQFLPLFWGVKEVVCMCLYVMRPLLFSVSLN